MPEEETVSEPVAPAPPQQDTSTSLTELILDSLPGWTAVAALIGLLYLVWVTLEILSKYMGGLPSVGA